MYESGAFCVPGFEFPDEVVIEKKAKGDSFVESTGADVRLSNIKFIQHDAIEGILCECFILRDLAGADQSVYHRINQRLNVLHTAMPVKPQVFVSLTS